MMLCTHNNTAYGIRCTINMRKAGRVCKCIYTQLTDSLSSGQICRNNTSNCVCVDVCLAQPLRLCCTTYVNAAALSRTLNHRAPDTVIPPVPWLDWPSWGPAWSRFWHRASADCGLSVKPASRPPDCLFGRIIINPTNPTLHK